MKLYPYQEEGVEWLLQKGRAVLADDMGLGKTAQVLRVCEQSKAARILIVAPKSLLTNWKREIELWIPGAPVTLLTGTLAKRKKAFESYREGFLLTNYESLRTLSMADGGYSNEWIEAFKKLAFGVQVYDEAHRLKNRKSQQTKGAFALAKAAHRLYLLTGTPVLNRGAEIWALLHMLQPRVFSSFWAFAKEWFDAAPIGWGGSWTLSDSPSNSSRFQEEVVKPYILRRTKEEVLKDLPEKYYQRMWVTLEGEQLRLYRQMEKEFVAEVQGGELIVAMNIISRITRLKQLCVAPSMLAGLKESEVPSAKLELLVDLVESTEDKWVVFSQFAQAVHRAKAALEKAGIGAVTYTGELSMAARESALHEWKTNPACRVFLGTVQVAGEGLTLTESNRVVFLDKYWTPAINEQAIARCHRIGQTRPVQAIELLAEETIEEWIEDTLARKEDVVRAVTGFAVRG
jgi:SNF2 family DNA or RNA helicase